MQFRLISAMVLFVGSYFPLALILLVQDVQKKFLDASFCRWASRSSCTFQILAHPAYAWSCVLVTGLALLITQWGLRKVKLRFDVEVIEAKSIPNDLINYVFPYVVSFMGLSFDDSGKMLGFAVFLVVLFVITYKSGQIVMNPFLIIFGWKIYEVKMAIGQNEGSADYPSAQARQTATRKAESRSSAGFLLYGGPMTQEAFDGLRAFDFDNADVYLWVFKRSTTAAKYTAYYVRTDDDLNATLKTFASQEKERITEWAPYNYLAQANENGCLSVGVDETNFGPLKGLVDLPEAERAVNDIRKLRGAAGYLVKFVHNGTTVYAARRSPTTWKPAYKKKGVINVFYHNGELSAVQGDEFTLEPNFDLFCLDDSILIANKVGFESVMQYRTGYVTAFGGLQHQPQFVALFTNMQPLIDHVGTNSMHLRRMAVIQEKHLYQNAGFMAAVQQVNAARNWGIQFDGNNRIVPTPETAALILKILLDQRLLSEITQIMYDVPDGVPVQ